jgi:hypothetical protein
MLISVALKKQTLSKAALALTYARLAAVEPPVAAVPPCVQVASTTDHILT